MATYLILLFSPFVEDPTIKYNIGWLMVGIVSFNLVVNMLFMVYDIFSSIKAYILKVFRLAKLEL